MNKKLHRLNTLFFLLLGFYIILAFSSNPPNGFTGAPGEGTCQSCHMQVNTSFAGNVEILGLPADIQPDNIYNITIRVTSTAGNPVRSGVELTTLDGSNQSAGTIVSTGAFLNLSSSSGRTYVKHSNAQPFSNNVTDYTFTWKAPGGPVGEPITMYVAAVLGNNGNGNGMDRVLTSTQSGTISAGPPALSVSIGNVSDVTCFGGNDGAAEATATGGTPPYAFSWSTGFMGAFPTNLSEGIYTVTCTDANNMTASASVTIEEPTQIIITTTSITAIDCENPNGTATVNASGGNPNYFYDWSNGENGPTATLLVAGVNMVTVTDQNNCEKMHSVFIPSSTNPPTADAGTAATLSCINNIVNLDGSNSSTGQTISYQWTTDDGNIVSGENTVMPEVDQPGTYRLEVRNENNRCSALDSVRVLGDLAAPQPDAGSDLALPCAQNSIMLDGSNSTGEGTLQFQWNTDDGNILTSPVNEIIEVDQIGTYILTTTQISNGCSATDTVEVTAPSRPVLSLASVDTPSCNNAMDGAIFIEVENGSGAHSFSWSTGDTTQNLDDISAGDYEVIVTDSTLCKDTLSIVLTEPDPLAVSFTVQSISEVGANDGLVNAAVSGGTSPYHFDWSNGADTSGLTDLGPGIYILTLTDNNGCSIIDTALVPDINCDNFAVETIITNAVNCPGSNEGSISIDNISGGIAPFSIDWSNGASTLSIDSLGEGSFFLAVTDSLGCMVRDTFNIEEEDNIAPEVSVNNVSIYLNENGMTNLPIAAVNAGASDNCGIDTVFLSSSSFDCTHIGQNDILLTAIDQSGNTTTASATVTVLDTITPVISCPDNIVSNNCQSINYPTPTVADNCDSGLQPMLVEGLNSGSRFPEGITIVRYEVVDQSGNSAQCDFEVELQNDLSIDNFLIENICDTFLLLTVEATGGSEPYNYSWASGQTGSSIQINGRDTLFLTDQNNCSSTTAYHFTAPEPLSLQIDTILNENNQSGNGSAFISVSGGTPPYVFNWSDNNGNSISSDEDLVNVSAGTYRLVMSDDNGCRDTITVVIDRLVNTSMPTIANSINIFPNPASGDIYISAKELMYSDYSVVIFDGTGKIAGNFEGNISGDGIIHLDIRQMNEGLYLLLFRYPGGTKVKKIFIK